MNQKQFNDAKCLVEKIARIRESISYYKEQPTYLSYGVEEILRPTANRYNRDCLELLKAAWNNLNKEFSEL